MKQRTRTVAAVVTTTMLAGGGLAATVTGLTQPSPHVVTSDPRPSAVEKSQQAALAAALDGLVARNRDVRRQVTTARRQLHRIDARLGHERRVASRLAVLRDRPAAAPASVPAAPRLTSPVPPPPVPVHTSTRASGSSGSTSGAPATHAVTRASGSTGSTSVRSAPPRVHTTTRASGASRPAGIHAARPKVHTTTRASGAKGGRHHERERERGDD